MTAADNPDVELGDIRAGPGYVRRESVAGLTVSKALTPEQYTRFGKVVREEFVPDVDANRWRPGLRIKRVQGVPKVFDMTWAPNGRATLQFGAPIRDGVRHVIWRRVGTHDIVTDA